MSHVKKELETFFGVNSILCEFITKMTSTDLSTAELVRLKKEIRQLSEFNTVTARDIVLHFQALKSARAPRLLMDAPGLYYPDLGLYVISKSGAKRGHATINNSITPLLPPWTKTPFGFVLYPESYVRSCLDKILRKTVKIVSPDMRISFENNFNNKYHSNDPRGAAIFLELLRKLQTDLGLQPVDKL